MGEGGRRSGSLSWWAGPVGEDAVWVGVEPSGQVPERAVTPGLVSGSCPFHREHTGLEVRGARGHSGGLRGPKESSRLHASQS